VALLSPLLSAHRCLDLAPSPRWSRGRPSGPPVSRSRDCTRRGLARCAVDETRYV